MLVITALNFILCYIRTYIATQPILVPLEPHK